MLVLGGPGMIFGGTSMSALLGATTTPSTAGGDAASQPHGTQS